VTRAPLALLAAAAALAAAAPARAEETIWDRAVADAGAAASRAAYARALEEGDDSIQLAGAEGEDSHKKRLVTRAVQAYRKAIAALPGEPEAHYRLGTTLFVYYYACDEHVTLLCDPKQPDPAIMREIVDRWQSFTTLAPLDTRGDGLLFSRALLHTKLGTRDDFLAAIADYEAFRKRADDATLADVNNAHANLAETYMMVGRLEDAIAMYEVAAIRSAEVSTIYGFAVALDRDGQRTRARQLIASLKQTGFETFQEQVTRGQTFFVPEEEVYFYFALVEEALGYHEQALVHYDRFLRSNAHPQYHPAADRNRKALAAKRKSRGER
jgi:tetratricopeptide (TPR) repeat protein